MNMQKWLDDLKKAKVKKAMPILSFPAIQLMGITIKDLISNADNQATGMKLIADKVPSLAAVSLMDLSVEAECFGSKVIFSDDEVPTIREPIISSLEEAKNLRIPKVGEKRTTIYIDAIKKAVKLITDRPIFAGVIGSFSLAGRLVGVAEAMIYCYEEPEMMHTVLDKCTAFIIDYIKEYKKVGANGVVIAEPLTGLLSLGLAEEFSEKYVKRIVDECQDENFIIIYHNCGNSTINIIDSILRTGSAVYHFGNAIDMYEMMKHIPSDIIVMGNIDPAGQFKNGTPQSIRQVTLDLMNKCCKEYRNFVVSSGCDIPPTSPWDNITAYFDAVEEYYGK